MVIVRQKERKGKEGTREERTCSRRVGTFQLNCKLKRIFYSRVVSTIGSDGKYSRAQQRLLSRIKFAIFFLDNLVDDFPNFDGKSNFVRRFPTGPFSKPFPIRRMAALDSSLVLFLSIDLERSVLRDSIVLVILHELPFPWIARSRLKRTGTRRSTGPFLPKFLCLSWYFRPRVKAIPCTDCKNELRIEKGRAWKVRFDGKIVRIFY